MDKNTARILVRETFQQAFAKERYVRFAKELLNHYEDSPFTYQGNYVPDAYKPYIQTLERIGKYEDPDGNKIDILIANLKKGPSLERARTMQRNLIAWYLNGSRGGELKDAALVAFVSPDSADWRFSLVRMEYKISETPKGRVKAQAEYTPARRYSFLVGENETSHTAQSRLVPVIEDEAHNPTLSRLEEAFNIEKATKEFFEQYRNLFYRVVEELDKLIEQDAAIGKDFEAKNVNRADFAKKLLGQIVFLYFLQKKGWFGVPRKQPWGSGSKSFVRELFVKKHGDYNNFFNDILEPLFYEALRLDRPEDYYSRFDCRIPFLNGGLFDPLNDYDWIETDILLPNELFSNEVKTKDGDLGTGILDIFDRYNFTVNEDEPLEKEVAVDPEMLGKVFENLLEVKDRKSKGTYYTPREIVHYMCQESLINYLATGLEATVGKKDIENLVRFGETVVEHESRVMREGRETRDYSFKLPESIRENAKLIDDYLETIRICDPAVGSGAFPVGMMSEIIRTRTTLNAYLGDSEGRTAYEFKRHAIQESLYGVDIDPGAVEIAKLRLWLALVVDEDERDTIQPLPNLDYKLVRGNSLLSVERDLLNFPLFQQLENLKLAFFSETNSKKKKSLKTQINELILKLTNGREDFDFEIYFSEVFSEKQGFDVVIANPPYVRQEEIKEFKALFKRNFECFTGTADLLVYFYERGVKLLRPGGTITLITSNKFYRAAYGEKLRGFLSRELTLLRLIDFGDAPVFEAIAYAAILVGARSVPKSDTCALAYTWEDDLPFERIAEVVPERGQQVLQSELKQDGWQLESPFVFRLLEKLRHAGRPLGDYIHGRFYRGILTGLNEAFVVDRATRDRLIREDKSSAELLKPFLRGRDVKRWRVEPQELWLIFTRRGVDIERYPAIKQHLLPLRDQLLPGGPDGRKPGKYAWYEIQDNTAYWQEFATLKIVYPDIAPRCAFALDSDGLYPDCTLFLIPEATKWLLAILNSQVVSFFFPKVCPQIRGNFMRFKSIYMSQIPIPEVSSESQQQLEQMVDRILQVKQRDAKADTAALEREIDQLVYKLYDLAPEEIALVEASHA